MFSSLAGNADGLMPDPFLDDVTPLKDVTKLPGGAAGVISIFDAIRKQINPELVKSVQAVYLFKVSGIVIGISTLKCVGFIKN